MRSVTMLKYVICITIIYILILSNGQLNNLYPNEQKCKAGSTIEFKCQNGMCIDLLRRCDWGHDCSDLSDEMNCNSTFCDPDTHFECLSGECIEISMVCDGALDCLHRDDEDNCATTKCKVGYFRCDSGHCIPDSWRCDEAIDCSDRSDEKNCSKSTKKCSPGKFMCSESQCIQEEYRCDGVIDCINGADEHDCYDTTNCPMDSGHYLCKDHSKCLDKSLVCDGELNCEDGSDENGHCGKRCTNSDVNCDQGCFRTPSGPKCYCKKGFKLTERNACVDINECEQALGFCDHLCHNENGSAYCSCGEGYELLSDKATCRIKEPALLLFTVGLRVVAKILDNSASWNIWTGKTEPSGVAFDPKEEMVYWIADKYVFVKKLHGEVKPRIFINQGLEKPENLAIDWIGRNLYITDYKKEHILACSLVGGHCVPILKNLPHPRALQLDLAERYIYWTDVISNSIERAGLDGSKRETILRQNITWPNGLALDFPANRMYWADAHFKHIQSSSFRGENIKTLPINAGHIFSMAVWQDRLYWTDWTNDKHREIHSCRKRDGKERRTEIKEESNQVSNIAIYHNSLFTTAGNPCNSRFGSSCSHLCLLSPTSYSGFTCACPEGMIKSQNGFTCHENEKTRLLLASESNLYFLNIRKYGKNELTPTNYQRLSLGTVADMDYDPVKKMVYFADSQKGEILSLNITNGYVKKILKDIVQPIAIAVDWMRGNVYWINGHHKTVEVTRTDGTFRNIVQKYLKNPSSISLDLVGGYLFVSDDGIIPSIHRCELDGSECIVLANEDIVKPSSIYFDSTGITGRLFWTDSFLGKIESVQIDGRNRREEIGHLQEPVKVVVTDNIMWTELKTPLLMMASKENTSIVNTVDLDIDRTIAGKLDFNGEWAINILSIGNHFSEPVTDICSHKCHQLCFSRNRQNPICGCAQGLQLMKDNFTCSVGECRDMEKKCDDGECILSSFWCDNDVDCNDGSDERNCVHYNTPGCTADQFHCDNNGHCKPLSDKCDGMIDCADNSDENHLFCKAYNCSREDEWKCESGECIPRQWRCNGEPTCLDGSDEHGCDTVECAAGEKKCDDGWCILASWWCDGAYDCRSGEDEKDCPCKLGEHKCKNNTCVDEYKLCMGEVTCEHEGLNCEAYKSNDTMNLFGSFDSTVGNEECPVNTRPCSKDISLTRCVPFSAWCNGTRECPRGEDEINCKKTCEVGYVKCKRHDSCIPKRWRCDKAKDCEDGSDEEGCLFDDEAYTKDLSCKSDEFECTKGVCISLSKVCDGYKDCLYGVDESQNCQKCQIQNGGCDQICKDGPVKPLCFCRNGYKINSDGISCSDINECEEEEYICHHNCVNTKGSYLCTCEEGYTLKDDRVTCKATSGLPWSIAIVSKDDVSYLTDDLSVHRKLQLKNSFGHDDTQFIYNPTNKSLLAIDGDKGAVYSQFGDKWVVQFTNFSRITAAGLDYINNNLYLAEANVHTNSLSRRYMTTSLKVCSLKNKICGTLSSHGHVEISSIEISPKLRNMFRCENDGFENTGRIVSEKLDATSLQVLAEEKILQCTSLALDEAKKRVYWIDSQLNRLESVDILGHDRRRFKTNEIYGAKGLIVINRSLLWFNTQTLMMVKCLIQNPKQCQELYHQSEISIMDIHQTYSENIMTPCTDKTCQHICVPMSPDVPHCQCADGYVFKNKSCILMNTQLNNLASNGYGESCYPNPCVNGICEMTSTGFNCRCPDEYEGRFCQQLIEESSNSGWIIFIVIMIILLIAMVFGIYWCIKTKSWTSLKVLRERNYGRFRFVNSSFGLMKEEGGSQPPTPTITRFNLEQDKPPFQVESSDSAIVCEDSEPLCPQYNIQISPPLLPKKTFMHSSRLSREH